MTQGYAELPPRGELPLPVCQDAGWSYNQYWASPDKQCKLLYKGGGGGEWAEWFQHKLQQAHKTAIQMPDSLLPVTAAAIVRMTGN